MFAKLFSSITESSLWSEPKEVRLLFVTMLAKADQSGFVEASIPGLARVANLTIEETQLGLECLSSPDPYSKNPDNEGRRVLAVPGGFMLLNYEEYRARRSPEERREYMREYMKDYRKKSKPTVNNGKPPLATVNRGNPQLAQAEAEAEADGEAEAKTEKKCSFFLQFWESYPKRRRTGKASAEKAWAQAVKKSDAATILEAVKRYAESPVGKGEFVKGPAAWLNGGHWEDDPSAWGIAAKPASRVFRPGPDWDGGDIYAYARSKGYDVP